METVKRIVVARNQQGGRDEKAEHAGFLLNYHVRYYGLPRWLGGKEAACQCRRRRMDPWVGKIPWRRKWQPTPVFLPGKSHGQRRLAGYSQVPLSEHTHTHTHTHTTICMPLYVTALASRLKSLQISLHLQEYLFMQIFECCKDAGYLEEFLPLSIRITEPQSPIHKMLVSLPFSQTLPIIMTIQNVLIHFQQGHLGFSF